MPEGLLRYLMLADTMAIQGALALMIASLASMVWLRRCTSDWKLEVARVSRRAMVVGAALGCVAAGLALWLQSAAMSDDGPAGANGMLSMMLNETHYGQVWKIGAVAIVLVLALSFVPNPKALPLAVLGVATFAMARAAVSHAAADGDFTVKVAIDWVHLVLVCLWVGMVLLGAFLALRRPVRTPAQAQDAAAWVSALSETATIALVLIGLTGILKIWWATPSVEKLLASSYGAVLLVKLTLVAMAAALGGINKFRVMPRLLHELQVEHGQVSKFQCHFVRVLRIEAVVLALVVVAAAVLSSTATPMEAMSLSTSSSQLENL
jgi:putative copper resistance protein D